MKSDSFIQIWMKVFLTFGDIEGADKKQAFPPLVQPHTDPAGEVARLQQMVSELQRQLHQGPPTVSPLWKREDCVPATEHEVMISGNPMEAARISGLVTRCDQESPTDTGACIHGDQHGETICERRDSLWRMLDFGQFEFGQSRLRPAGLFFFSCSLFLLFLLLALHLLFILLLFFFFFFIFVFLFAFAMNPKPKRKSPTLANRFGQSNFLDLVCHGGPRRVGPRRVKGGSPKFRAFFFPLPPPFRSFLSLWGSFLGILVVFLKAGTLKCARLEFSGCRVKPRRPHSSRGERERGREEAVQGEGRGFTQPENSNRAHLRVPGFKNTTKIQREDAQRDRKRAKWWRERGKKKARNVRWSGGGSGRAGGVRWWGVRGRGSGEGGSAVEVLRRN